MTYSALYAIIYTVERGKQPQQTKKGDKMAAVMTDKQLQFIAWLITTATDKCQTIEEVREMNEQIRKHSAGLQQESDSDK